MIGSGIKELKLVCLQALKELAPQEPVRAQSNLSSFKEYLMIKEVGPFSGAVRGESRQSKDKLKGFETADGIGHRSLGSASIPKEIPER